MSKFIVPIESPWLVSYPTFFESSIVSLEIVDVNVFFIRAMVNIISISG